MTIADAETATPRSKPAEWNWLPPLPLKIAPMISWPLRPMGTLRWFAAFWAPLSGRFLYAVLAVVSWLYLQPALERCVTFEFDWILQIYARNMCLMFLVAGGLHLYFYTFRKQGSTFKFNARDLETDSPRFTFGNQVWDNMFWSCASGVTIWTGYEVLFMWAYANDYIVLLDWRENAVWLALCLLLSPIWISGHFFVVHRLLHWPPLYKLAHAVHHRNSNVGPWSGFSMHPIEHVLYMSAVLIFVFVPTHPILILFLLHFAALAAASSHTGFERIQIRGTKGLRLSTYFHLLHHRYFECNYGETDVYLDGWFGSFHDGTPEANRRLRESRRQGFAG